jgi:hypothetical protein
VPLDPRVPLGVEPPQPSNTLGMMADVVKMQKAVQEMRDLEDERRAQAEMQQILQQSGGDFNLAIKTLAPKYPQAALELQTRVGKAQQESYKAVTEQTKADQAKINFALGMLPAVDSPESYALFKQSIAPWSPELAEMLPSEYTPELKNKLLEVGLSAKDLLDRRDKALKEFDSGDKMVATAGYLATANTAEEWDQTIQFAKLHNVRQEDLALFGSFSPENKARAEALSLKPEKRAELAGQAEGRQIQREGQAITVRGQDLSAATQRRGQDISASTQRRGQDLTDARAKEGAAGAGPGGVKLSVGQQEDLTTIKDLTGLIDESEKLGKELNWEGVGAGFGGTRSKLAGQFGLGGNVEKKEQLRNSIGNLQGTIAKLRGGTSFTASEKEMLSNYTPTIDDGDERIQAKLKSLRGFLSRREANILEVAGARGGGQPAAAAPTTGAPRNVANLLNSQGPGRYTLSDGSVWVKNPDGSTRREK